jgi:hypothetical protein
VPPFSSQEEARQPGPDEQPTEELPAVQLDAEDAAEIDEEAA